MNHYSSEILVYSPVNYESLIIIIMIFNDVYGNTEHINITTSYALLRQGWGWLTDFLVRLKIFGNWRLTG